MARASVSLSVSMAGETASTTQSKTQDGIAGVTPTCTPATEGVLTTRTNTTVGVITLAGTTDITSADKVVLTWEDAAGHLKHRYNVAVVKGGVSPANTLTTSSGAGDDLPAALSDINASKQVRANIGFDGDDLEVFAIMANVRGVVACMDGTDGEKKVFDLPAGGMTFWNKDGGITSPITGTAVTYTLSGSGDSSTTNFLPKILALYNASDPSGSGV
jgi:hypothetical protein